MEVSVGYYGNMVSSSPSILVGLHYKIVVCSAVVCFFLLFGCQSLYSEWSLGNAATSLKQPASLALIALKQH